MGAEARAEDSTPLTPKAIATRERILDAAEAVFADRGFDAATTREIAALSKTNVATAYSYFANKEALYAAVLERAIEPLIALMDRFASERDKPGAMTRATHEVVSHLAKHEHTTRLVYREVVADGPMAEWVTKALFEPLLDRVRTEIRDAERVNSEMEPFIAALFVHLSFSHVALAPLLSRLFDRDMLSPESVDQQVRVIGAAAGLAISGFDGDD